MILTDIGLNTTSIQETQTKSKGIQKALHLNGFIDGEVDLKDTYAFKY